MFCSFCANCETISAEKGEVRIGKSFENGAYKKFELLNGNERILVAWKRHKRDEGTYYSGYMIGLLQPRPG